MVGAFFIPRLTRKCVVAIVIDESLAPRRTERKPPHGTHHELWTEHRALLTVLGVIAAGISVTAVVVWLIRRIVKPIIAIAVSAATTAIGATVSGFVADASAIVSSWNVGG